MNLELEDIVAAVEQYGSHRKAGEALGISKDAVFRAMKRAAQKGLVGFKPVMPGFRVSQVTSDGEGNTKSIQQKPEHGEIFKVPDGHIVRGVSALINPDGEEIVKWVKTSAEAIETIAWRDALDEFKRDLPRLHPSPAPILANNQLLAQYTVTDLHFGMLAWKEETGDADYDLQIAEKLLVDWFTAAVAMSPSAHTAVFAQLGDLLHYDSMESVTPAHRHNLDADSRPQKMVRVVIRVIRRIIAILLEKHQNVHVIMAKANHDPYSSAWLREILAVMYEDEPRLTVDTSPAEYYAYEFGNVALFYHHGHKRGVGNVDTVFAGMFREIFGRCRYSYGHVGHLHSDEVKEGNLMKVERHRTLAPSDSYAAGGGWLSGRDAKVSIYHRQYGEVSRLILSPEMVQSQ